MLPAILLIIFAFVLGIVKLFNSLRDAPLREVPTPDGQPLVGNAFQINPEKPHFTFSDWAKKLGDVYYVKVFGKNLVVLNSYASIHEALVEKGPQFAGRPRTFRISCITNKFRNIGFSNPSRPWWILRNIAHRQFKAYGEGVQRLEDITAEILDEMKMEITSAGEESAVDIRSSLYSATMSIVCAFLVGKRYHKSDEEFKLFREMERLGIKLVASAGKGAELDALPWLRFFGNETYRQLERFMTLRDDLYERMRDRALKNADQQEADGILGAIIRAANDPKSQSKMKSPYDSNQNENEEAFNEEFAKGTFVDLILCGTASTTNTVYAFINLLLHHPEVYENIQCEIDEVMKRKLEEGDEAGGNNNQEFRITVSDKSSMPYLQASLLEAMRYVSIAPFTVPHVAMEDSSLDGYAIPKGTEVLCNLWALHHDEKLFEDPWQFKPERFLEGSREEGWALVAPDHPNRKHLMAFGGGPRRCTGEVFAMSRLFLILTSILKDLHFSPDPKNGLVSIDPHTYELGIAFYPLDYTMAVKPGKHYKTTCDYELKRSCGV